MQYKVYRTPAMQKPDYDGEEWQRAIDCWSYWRSNQHNPIIKVFDFNNVLVYSADTKEYIEDWSRYLLMNRVEKRIMKEMKEVDFHGDFDKMSNDDQDAIINPKHYKMIPKEAYDKFPEGLEYIDLMEYILKQHKGVKAHLLGHIFKYAMRLGKKDASLQDAKKIEWYANRLVKVLEGSHK
jgi:hypothetical protein